MVSSNVYLIVSINKVLCPGIYGEYYGANVATQSQQFRARKPALLFPPLPAICQGPSGTRSPAGTVLLAAFSSDGKTRIFAEFVRVLHE